ncbi:MAG TPA: methyltransferase domain-containing protein [Terriglobales bacterium]|nr:methyltransferase domain-containing protein [Terriglobales bacterium]
MVNTISERFSNLLVCPFDRSKLVFEQTRFSCQKCKREFRVSGRIPLMLDPGLFQADLQKEDEARKKEEMEIFDNLSSYQNFMNRAYLRAIKEDISNSLSSFELKDKDILEIGAGISLFAGKLAEKNRVILTDINETLLNQNPESCDLVVADAENLPFPDKSFDFIYLVGILHHLPDQKKGMQEIKRVLKEGGKVFISEPTKWSVNSIYYLGRKLLIFLFGKNFVRKLVGCGTPDEEFLDIKELNKTFSSDFQIRIRKISPIRLLPIEFFDNLGFVPKINHVLEKIPIIKNFGAIAQITLLPKK